jgi:ABC-2 type transport system permease protein
MSIRRVLALSIRIVRQFARDRRTLGLLFGAPLLVMTLLNFVLNNSTASLTLGIVPPDGPAGQGVTGQIQELLGPQTGLTIKTIARDDVDAAIKRGDADGVLVFPPVLAFGALAPVLRLDGSNPAAARQLSGLVAQLVTALQHQYQFAPSALASPGASAASAQETQAAVQAAPAPAPITTPPPTVVPQGQALAVSYLYGGPEYTQTDAFAPLLIGIFAFFFVFLLTSVAFLRERSQGTIERLMVSPLSKAELVLGYVLGFTLFALLQSLIILLFVVGVLRVHYAGNLGLIFLVTLVLTIGGVNMGIFVSAFARNELQVIQFIPLLLVPQVLLGGLFFPVETLPVVLKQLAYAFPLTYANFALKDVMLKGMGLPDVWPDLAFIAGFAVLMVLLAALSLRQERA